MGNDAYINSVNLNLRTEFPYLVLNIEGGTSKPLNPGFHVMHWHEDLQFIYVLDGHIIVKTLEDEAEVLAGEGIFINKKVVHMVASTEHDRYKSFVFPDYFVSFYFGSPAAKLTQKITSNTQIRLIAIRQNSSWGGCAIPLLQQLVALEGNKDEFYGYEVLVRLSRLWLLLLKNVEIPEVLPKNVTAVRMRYFLQCIEENYAREISLEELAKSANVSKSECLRCFRATLQTTPYKYLMDFRLKKAVDLLLNTDMTIGHIAEAVGFRQQSYFGKCFREKLRCSPTEYRAKNK